jgi:cobalamin biosynthesis protein CobD/CbiB
MAANAKCLYRDAPLMVWVVGAVGIAAGIVAGVLAGRRLHPAVAACVGIAAIAGFFGAVLYGLNHYDECGDCTETTGADITAFIAYFCFALAPTAIVLAAVKFVWMLTARRSR